MRLKHISILRHSRAIKDFLSGLKYYLYFQKNTERTRKFSGIIRKETALIRKISVERKLNFCTGIFKKFLTVLIGNFQKQLTIGRCHENPLEFLEISRSPGKIFDYLDSQKNAEKTR